MDENKQKSNSQKKPNISDIGDYITSSVWRAVVVFAVIGFSVSNTFRLTMNSETWFWFFSSIAQTFAALVALVAIFLISRLELYDTRINNSIETMSVIIKPLILEGKQDFVESDEWLLNKARSIINIGATTYTKNLIKKE